MNAYKYMTSEGGIRFLSNWYLRITPPVEFNDPFELRPPVEPVITEDFVSEQFKDELPQMAIAELTTQLTPALSSMLTQQEIADLADCIIRPADANKQARLIKKISRKIPNFSSAKFVEIQRQVQMQWPMLAQQAAEMAQPYLPKINSMIKHGFNEQLPMMLGVLCLSRNQNQPLMWAHYSDSHKGLMLEFDISHPAFNRKRSKDDDFGYLRPVLYSKNRPPITMQTLDGDSTFEVFALTKADPWSYEEEIRLIWPLKSADKTVDGPTGSIELLSFPSSAVVSVTLGCKASQQTLDQVRQILWDQQNTKHIIVRKARLDEVAFKLNYFDI